MAVMKYIEQIILTYRYPVTEFTLVYSVPVSRLFPKLKKYYYQLTGCHVCSVVCVSKQHSCSIVGDDL